MWYTIIGTRNDGSIFTIFNGLLNNYDKSYHCLSSTNFKIKFSADPKGKEIKTNISKLEFVSVPDSTNKADILRSLSSTLVLEEFNLKNSIYDKNTKSLICKANNYTAEMTVISNNDNDNDNDNMFAYGLSIERN